MTGPVDYLKANRFNDLVKVQSRSVSSSRESPTLQLDSCRIYRRLVQTGASSSLATILRDYMTPTFSIPSY